MNRRLVTFLCVMFILTACNTSKESRNEAINTQQMKNDWKKRPPNSQIDSPLVEEKSDDVHQSKDLVQLIETVEGVDQSYVIVSGIYTVVGIEPEKTLSAGEENDVLRKEVYNVIKGNAHGRNAAITTDPAKIAKIKQLGKRAAESKNNMQEQVYNELGILIGKIKPLSGQYKSTKRQDMHEKMNENRSDLYE